MASPDLYHLLTVEIGWTNGRYQQRLAQVLEADLMATSPAAVPSEPTVDTKPVSDRLE